MEVNIYICLYVYKGRGGGGDIYINGNIERSGGMSVYIYMFLWMGGEEAGWGTSNI